MENIKNIMLNEQIKITDSSLGHGSFGKVFKGIVNGQNVAIKCETKKNAETLTLLREFKVCRKVYLIKKYLKKLANDEECENDEKSNSIKIMRYIVKENLLNLPDDFNIEYIYQERCIPETFTYFECNDYNFLTMELCGENLEKVLEKYIFMENCKYFFAYHLLHIMALIHTCGIISRDIKLSNIVLNKNIREHSDRSIKPLLIDLGLAKEFVRYEYDPKMPKEMRNKYIFLEKTDSKSITGTPRYISLNIHQHKSPMIVDDLISLTYSLIVIFMDRNLPWVGCKKDDNAFNKNKHTLTNCKCNYHRNKKNGKLKQNYISDIKFHTPYKDLVDNKYKFLIKWLEYLYNLDDKMPDYNYLYSELHKEFTKNGFTLHDLYFNVIEKE